MPLFFLLSGLTYRRQGIATAISAAITYIILSKITHIFGLILALLVTGQDIGLSSLLRPIILLQSFSLGVTWFLVAISIVRLLFTLILEGGPRLKATSTLLLAASLCLSLISDTTAFQIHTWWAGVLFYMMGYLCINRVTPRLAPKGPNAWPRKWIVAGFALSAAATTLLAPLNLGCALSPFDSCGTAVLYGHPMVRMIAGQYGFLPLFVVTAFCGTACVVLLSALLAGLPTSFRKPWVWAGRNSLTLLILNGCFLVTANGFIRVMAKDMPNALFPWGVLLAAVVLHIVALPFAIPIVSALQIKLHQIAQSIVSHIVTTCFTPVPSTDGGKQ
jgi:hypothetical protein